MRLLLKRNIFLVFWIIALLDIIGTGFNLQVLHYIFKPLLMPVLIAAVILFTQKTSGRKIIIAALFFSLLGDVFLLLDDKNTLFFIAGLIYFLITHLLYISYFMKIRRNGRSLLRQYPFIIGLIILYIAGLLFLLIPKLGNLKIPVIIYACIIGTMLFYSLMLPYSINKKVRASFISGAILFVISDSLLAINKFYQSFPLAAVFIMLTYCAAQYFIVKGFIKNQR
jgi:uncharacterized membrane protein YhhN